MMKKYKKIILIISLLVIAPIFLYYAYYAVCWQIYLHDPNIVQHKIEAYRQLSSDKLIKKLGFWNIWWFDKALDILVERKDEEAVPYIINLLNSPYKYKRDSAIRALAKIGDKRAIEPLLAITEKGRKHSDYFDALHALAKLHYKAIYPLALELTMLDPVSDSREDYRSSGITMLENFPDEPETFPTLKKIAETDPEEYIRDKAKKVIEKLSLSTQ